jgi:hypothetical protein
MRNILLLVLALASATLAACGNSSTRDIEPMKMSVMEPECTFTVASYGAQVVAPGIGRIVVDRKCPRDNFDRGTSFSVFTALNRVPRIGTVVQVVESLYDYNSNQYKSQVIFLK